MSRSYGNTNITAVLLRKYYANKYAQDVVHKTADGGITVPVYFAWELQQDDCYRIHNITLEVLPTVYVSVVLVPILLILSTFGNILNIWILTHHCQPGVKQVFLLALALSDMLVM